MILDLPGVFEDDKPIYIQLMERFRYDIVSGNLEMGEKISSVRTLAQKFGVNPNTVQKALSELEEEGLLYTERTAGRFVTENSLLLESVRYKEARRITGEFISKMQDLGYSEEEMIGFLPKDSSFT